MTSKLLKRAYPAADWAIGGVDGAAVYEVRRLRNGIDKFIVVACHSDGTVRNVDSVRGMAFERAKERATRLAGQV